MAPKDSEATVAVNVEELRNSKDAVIMRLMALQSYIADLSKAYLEHANSVINGGSATIDIPALPVGLSSHFDLGMRATSPGAKSEAGGPKKRKRAPVDPNAPKRALTPYFLFMQSNRAQIAQDLGPNVKPKEVADEGTRRWQNMEPKEKEVWKQLYQENYEDYKAKMAAYKAGQKVDDEQDPAASQLQQDFAGAESANETESSESESESESEEESPSPQPPKEKTPPRSTSKRRKSDAKPAKESPVKKTRGKNAEPASASKEKPQESAKRKTKKRKSEA